jgi:hypothetical protein
MWGLIGFILATGCGAGVVNPSFPISIRQADAELARMAREPIGLKRPLVIVSGFMDPGLAAFVLRSRLRAVLDDPQIITIIPGDCMTMECNRQRIIDGIEKAFPSDDPEVTVECDIVAYSLGGVAARYAAMPPEQPGGRRLRIHRLFTISSPHRGAAQANWLPSIHPIQAALRDGSPWLAQLNDQPAGYPVYPYILLGDQVIGEPNAAPLGQTVWWVPCPPLNDPHAAAFNDPRILADIARRLRDEPPLAQDPPAPLPKK